MSSPPFSCVAGVPKLKPLGVESFRPSRKEIMTSAWLKQNESAQILVLINRVRSLFTFRIKPANGGPFQLYKFSLIPIVQNVASPAGILSLGHIDHHLLLGLYEPLITA